MVETASVLCPYCGETFNLFIDGSAGNQEYVEDCEICCKPIDLRITVDTNGELLELLARRYDE